MTNAMDTNDRNAHPLRLRSHDLTWQEVEDEIVVLDLRRSRYFRLNGSGALLWNLLAQSASHATLVTELVRRFGVDSTHAGHDVEVFVQGLQTRQLLEPG